MSEQTAVFRDLRPLEGNAYELFFEPPRGFSFQAGQYVSIVLPQLEDKHPREAFRDFSLASSCQDTTRASVIFRDSDSHFKSELKKMKAGDTFILEGPAGNFTLSDTSVICWVAGGIGITPFLCMIRSGDTRQRDIELLYFNSKNAAVIGQNELNGSGVKVQYKTGKVNTSILSALPDSVQEIMVAGPPAMVEQTISSLRELGYDMKMIRTEEFAGYDII